MTLLDLLAMLGAVLGREVRPLFDPPRAGDVRHSQADMGRARTMLGYSPTVEFDEGLARTLDWARHLAA